MLIISVTCLLSSRVCELDLHNGEMWVGDCLEPSCYNLICSALGCVYMTRHLRTYLPTHLLLVLQDSQQRGNVHFILHLKLYMFCGCIS